MAEKGKHIYSALQAVQRELKAPKGQFNSFGKYRYRSCEDIVEAVKPLLNEQGLILLMSDEVVDAGIDTCRFYIKATAQIIDIVTGDKVEVTALARESYEKKGMDDSQITGTASSYARKYALNGLFAIDDTKDADTDQYRTQTTPASDDAVRKQCINKLNAEIKKLKLTADKVKEIAKQNMGKTSVNDMSETEILTLQENLEKWSKGLSSDG